MPEIDLQQVIKDQAGINEKLSEAVGILQKELKEARRVIEFYADLESQTCITCDCEDPEVGNFVRQDDFESMDGWAPHGKKAREYLNRSKSP